MADYYFYNNGTGDTDWNNPNNWFYGPNGAYPIADVPNPVYGDMVHIQTDLDSNIQDIGNAFTIDSGATVTINGSIFYWQNVVNNGTLIVNNGDSSNFFNGGMITNYGTIYNMYGAITLYGSITNYGLFINNAIINPQSGSNGLTNLGTFYNNILYNNIGYIDNTSGLFINNGTFNNAGLFVRGAFTNNGTFNNNYFFNNIGYGDTDWNNDNNWWLDQGSNYSVGGVPTIDPIYDTINILTPLDTNIPQFLTFKTVVTYPGTITINSITINRNSMNLNDTTVLNNNHCFINENSITLGAGSQLNNYSHFSNEGTVVLAEPYGTVYNIVSGYLENSGAILINDINCNFNEAGSMYNTGGIFINSGSLSAVYVNPVGYTGRYVLNGSSTNFYETSSWFYDDTAIMATSAIPTIDSATIIVNDSILDGDTAPVNITYPFINNNIYNINSNAVNINSLFTNNGMLNINSNSLSNNGTLMNAGIINNNNTFINNGTLGCSLSGTINNNGTFTYGDYTTRFKGPIYPQVPSSASWGNIFI